MLEQLVGFGNGLGVASGEYGRLDSLGVAQERDAGDASGVERIASVARPVDSLSCSAVAQQGIRHDACELGCGACRPGHQGGVGGCPKLVDLALAHRE